MAGNGKGQAFVNVQDFSRKVFSSKEAYKDFWVP